MNVLIKPTHMRANFDYSLLIYARKCTVKLFYCNKMRNTFRSLDTRKNQFGKFITVYYILNLLPGILKLLNNHNDNKFKIIKGTFLMKRQTLSLRGWTSPIDCVIYLQIGSLKERVLKDFWVWNARSSIFIASLFNGTQIKPSGNYNAL